MDTVKQVRCDDATGPAIASAGCAPSQEAIDLFADGSVEVSQVRPTYGFSRASAYEMMASGVLPYTRIGRKRLIPKRAIAAALAAGLVNISAK